MNTTISPDSVCLLALELMLTFDWWLLKHQAASLTSCPYSSLISSVAWLLFILYRSENKSYLDYGWIFTIYHSSCYIAYQLSVLSVRYDSDTELDRWLKKLDIAVNLTNITDTKSVSALSTSAPIFVGGKSDMKYRHDQYRKMTQFKKKGKKKIYIYFFSHQF